jgi:uncharacterized membrane protein YidH (DUF202 family)
LREVLVELGKHPLLGILTTLVACIAFAALEYLRLTDDTRRPGYLPLVKSLAVTAAILSLILIVSRFVAVESP